MIYIAQPIDGGLIKIGCSKRISVRMKQLAKEHGTEFRVLGVHPGAFREENAIHHRFKHLLQSGREWFRPGVDLALFIVQDVKEWNGKDEIAVKFIRFRPKLARAMAACAKAQRLSIDALITIAVEQYLERKGYWPPKSDD